MPGTVLITGGRGQEDQNLTHTPSPTRRTPWWPPVSPAQQPSEMIPSRRFAPA